MTFAELTLEKALERTKPLTTAGLTANRRFVQGDHWQDGAGWVGPLLRVGDEVPTAEFLEMVKRVFVSQNVLGEGVGRHAGGVVGQEIAWDLQAVSAAAAPGNDTTASATSSEALRQEALEALTLWWDQRDLLGTLQSAVRRLLYDDNGLGGAHVGARLYVPQGRLETGEAGTRAVPRQATLADALALIWPDVPEPEQMTLLRDPDTMQQAGLYTFRRDETDRAELCFLDEAGATVLRLLEAGGQSDAAPLDLGGRLLHHQMTRSAFLTEQARSLQRLHNKAWTVLSRNLDVAGFIARFFLDASPPGTWERQEDGTYKHIPAPVQLGPGSASFIAPSRATEMSADGQETTRWGSPRVHESQPVPVTTFTDTLAATRHALLEELDQLHTVISGDATTSAKSRVQALADYLLSLRETQSAVQALVRWLLETALALAAQFMGTPGRYAALRAEATCRLDLGPIDPETMRAVLELVEKRLLSRETGMGRVGVEDAQAEWGRIVAEAAQLTEAAAAPSAAPTAAHGAGTTDTDTDTGRSER